MTKQQVLEQKNKINRKCRFFLRASLFLVILAVLIKMVLSNRAATWGKTYETIQSETEQLKEENQILRTQLAEKTGGLNLLEEQARRLGFTDQPLIKYFSTGVPVAQQLP
jgi:cell division protein FtsB